MTAHCTWTHDHEFPLNTASERMIRRISSTVRWRKTEKKDSVSVFQIFSQSIQCTEADFSQLMPPQTGISTWRSAPSLKAWRETTTRRNERKNMYCMYSCWCPITDQYKGLRAFERRMESGFALTSKPGKGIEFLNTSWILQDGKVTLSDLKEKLLKSSTQPPPGPPTYSSQADGQSINYLNAHRDVRSSGQHFNEKQRADWLLTGPVCFWLPLLQQQSYIYRSGCD